jgi:hypothetical protein
VTWFGNLRLIVYLRRGVIALERIVLALESIASAVERQSPSPLPPSKPRPTEFGTFDRAAAEKRWRQEREAAGDILDEEQQ